MMFQTGNRRNRPDRTRRSRGFTLIELILVMTLLLILFSVTLPSFKSFFHGRDVDSEARRFVALTRYGQSRAISEGLPMMLWVNRLEGTYGLRAQNGFAPDNGQSPMRQTDSSVTVDTITFKVADKLRFEPAPDDLVRGPLASIRFAPDGSVDESSPRSVIIRQEDGEEVAIVQSENRLNYEISQNANAQPQRYR
ncbi:MAG: prepilin-type N-terminal cleavage/methylation domain-containing protein [Limisphaerales bacterium]